jgi:hypothetical protein
MNAAKTPDAVAVDEEDQEEEAKKLDYEVLDRLIDSISRDFSRSIWYVRNYYRQRRLHSCWKSYI